MAGFGLALASSHPSPSIPRKTAGLLVKIGDELFEPIKSHIALRRGHYLRGYAYRFIEGCQPELKEEVVRASLSRGLSQAYQVVRR